MFLRDNPHQEIEILMKFIFLIVFTPNEHKEVYHNRKPNDEKLLYQLKDKYYVFVGEKVISFEINEKIVSFSSEHGFNNIKFAFPPGEKNIYLMHRRKYIPIEK